MTLVAGDSGVQILALEDGLHIRPAGWRVLLTLRRDVTVPWAAVTRVAVEPPPRLRLFARVYGTDVPGRLKAGTFRTDGKRLFVWLKRARQVLVIDADGYKGSPYDRYVIEVGDPDHVAEALDAQRRRRAS